MRVMAIKMMWHVTTFCQGNRQNQLSVPGNIWQAGLSENELSILELFEADHALDIMAS